MAEAFKGIGLENLPVGVADLTSRQRTFCLEYLRTGCVSEAARRAGYSEPSKNGAKVRRHAIVAAFLTQAAGPVAKEATQLIIRNSERSRALHTVFMAEMEKSAAHRNPEKLAKLANALARTDALLGALNGVGKVSGVHVTGDVNHTVAASQEVTFTLPPTALPVFAQMRRDVTVARTGGLTGGGN